MKTIIFSSLFIASTYGHGLVLSTIGANGVTAPGACVRDGTPRNCVVNACGAQADTAIIRDDDIKSGKSGPLGFTQGSGNCQPEEVIARYMGTGVATRDTGREPDGRRVMRMARGISHLRRLSNRQVLPPLPPVGQEGQELSYPQETIVGDLAGRGAEVGLPTTDDLGQITLIWRQVDQDGAGPLTAAIDATSAATDYLAFKSAKVTQNVPGNGVSGLSTATNTNFMVKVQLPEGMVCEGEVAGVSKVCFVRVRNQAFAGPFGGAGFFTQSNTARKRAVEERQRKLKRENEN